MRSLEEKEVQKGPGPYYALKASQRDKPVKKLTFKIKIGLSGIRRLSSFEADSEHL